MNMYNFYNLETYLKQNNIKCEDGAYLRWIKAIINTKIGMFSYDNLPNGLTSQIVECALMFFSNLCLYKSPTLGIVLCRYVYGGVYDIYMRPITVDLLALNGEPIEYGVPFEDIILVRDYTMDITPFIVLRSYIDRIIEMERTLDINLILVRLPLLFQCSSKEQSIALKQIFKKVYDFEPFAITDKTFKRENIVDTKIDLPVSPSDLYDLITDYKTLTLEDMGIYTPIGKKERSLQAEIDAQNDYADFTYANMKKERELTWELARKKWNINTIVVETFVQNKMNDIELKGIEAETIAQAEQVESEGNTNE